ncbi:hypothetical protein LM67_21760 [Salmonella enterica]|nr:hypothetical protein LM67_21760 [Salmonella enterica]
MAGPTFYPIHPPPPWVCGFFPPTPPRSGGQPAHPTSSPPAPPRPPLPRPFRAPLSRLTTAAAVQ